MELSEGGDLLKIVSNFYLDLVTYLGFLVWKESWFDYVFEVLFCVKGKSTPY